MPAARAAVAGKSALEASSPAALARGCLQEALVLRGLSFGSRVVSGADFRRQLYSLDSIPTAWSVGPGVTPGETCVL